MKRTVRIIQKHCKRYRSSCRIHLILLSLWKTQSNGHQQLLSTGNRAVNVGILNYKQVGKVTASTTNTIEA